MCVKLGLSYSADKIACDVSEQDTEKRYFAPKRKNWQEACEAA
jgi:hypothetical protein